MAVEGDRIVRGEVAANGGFPTPGALELLEFDPAVDRYTKRRTIAPSHWNDVTSFRGVCAEGSLIALQPFHFQNSQSFCDIVELGPGEPRSSRVPLTGHRLFFDSVTAIDGEDVLAVNHDGSFRPRLHVVRRNAAGSWAVAQVIDHDPIHFAFVPKYSVFVEADQGHLAIGCEVFLPLDVLALIFERGADGVWRQSWTVQRPEGAFAAGRVTDMGFAGSTLALSMADGPHGNNPRTLIFRRLGDGSWTFDQLLPPTMRSHTVVASSGGRLALSHEGTTQVIERDGAGRYSVVQEFRGLEYVSHLSNDRIAGSDSRYLTGQIRVLPLSPQGPPIVNVCRDRGVVVCDPLLPAPARLRAYVNPELGWLPEARLVAHFEAGPPGALAYAFYGYDIGWNPAANGALCITGASAVRSTPSVIDAAGNASVALPVEGILLQSLIAMPLYVQGLVVGATTGETHALRIVGS